MQLIFVDDSKQQGKRHGMGKLIALGALAFPEDQLKPFSDAFYEAYDRHGVPRHIEMKWSLGKRNWLTENSQLLTPLRKEIIQAAALHGGRVIVVIWDCERVKSANGKGPEEGVIDFLFERVTMMLEKSEPHTRGVLVFDKPGGGHKQEDEWISGTRGLTAIGTDYVKSTAVVIPILTAPSHHHPHLQTADLITGCVTNAIAGGKYGLELLPLVRPMFHKNWRGSIGGTGLKLYPDDLNNLCHWLLSESDFSRGLRGFSLPYKDWAYADDPGLPSK
jgi:hypothetical protein